MKTITGFAAARDYILTRPALADMELPAEVLDFTERALGEPLLPEQAVARIVNDVRARGDDAVREYARRLDGVELDVMAATPAEIFGRIARGDVFTIEVQIPEGSNAFDIAAIIYRAGLGGETEALRHALPREGFLFPAVYRFKRRTTAGEAIGAMARRFEQAWRELGVPEQARREIATLASLVEKEAVLPAERPLIAAVYRNRLERGMKLDCDPTVEYAARLTGRWRGTIYKHDLEADHPYNTYKRAGLPPGPIANPGMASLRAAVAPAETKALYFVAKPDGSGAHVFSSDFESHARAVNDYRRGISANAGGKRKPGGKSPAMASGARRRAD